MVREGRFIFLSGSGMSSTLSALDVMLHMGSGQGGQVKRQGRGRVLVIIDSPHAWCYNSESMGRTTGTGDSAHPQSSVTNTGFE